MRRLLEAVRATPTRRPQFALLPNPQWTDLDQNGFQRIHKYAEEYYQRFRWRGARRPEFREGQMEAILADVAPHDWLQKDAALRRLGVTPIWYDDHDRIADIIQAVSQ